MVVGLVNNQGGAKSSSARKGIGGKVGGDGVREAFTDLLAGPTDVIPTSEQIYQSLDLP